MSIKIPVFVAALAMSSIPAGIAAADAAGLAMIFTGMRHFRH